MPLERGEHAAVITHPLARETLTRLRDVETDSVQFREELVRLGRICGYELAASHLETESTTVRTPLTETTGTRIRGREDVVLVNVLRAATPFVEGLQTVFPEARQGVISASRDESEAAQNHELPVDVQYVKLPEIGPDETVIVADPMLATGSTMTAVLQRILLGSPEPERLVVLSAVSAPTGLERVAEAVPTADLVTVSVDDHLDENSFIVPGLGDAGDRAFGTE